MRLSKEAFQDKTLNTFLEDGRLLRLPVKEKKKRAILDFLVEHFEAGVVYVEQEVNGVLLEFTDDYTSIRRAAFIDYGYMQRDRKGNYWRIS